MRFYSLEPISPEAAQAAPPPADVWQTVRSFGYVYYEAYGTPGRAIGWVTRKTVKDPVTGKPTEYTACYSDGKRLRTELRGTFVNARKFVTELAAFYKT